MLFQADDVVDVRGETVKFEPIGIGKPLKVELVSVYVGSTRMRDGELLVMSTAKDPDAPAGSVVAMNWWGDGVASRETVPLHSGTAGTRVIYYSPAESATLLSISVKLKFDYFPRDVVQAWADAAANIAGLPVLIGGMALAGPAGAASAQAIVGVAGAGAKLGIALLDRAIDGSGVISMDWPLSIADPGAVAQRAGFVLLTEDNRVLTRGQADNVVAGYASKDVFESVGVPEEFLEVDGRSFYVDGQDQVLRHAAAGSWSEDWPFQAGDQVRGPWPYALVKAHGADDEDLKKWKPAAVTADLAAKFLNRDRDAELPELTEAVFTAYSDVTMLKRAARMKGPIDAEKDDAKKELLEKQRDALLDSIQDEKLQELATGKA
ncbi:hypothetical protein [Agrococcus jenensis]|uniref:Uncharacterized protein n=1 Tax=Agrococcus jenensis TaxID=46353 RepID=A0A3N2AUI9_9MICO|nr:hypothetical protein [Agrococcus jenensis]ROR66615.1 hypothetical protein EDD26_2007 [Agrococcus jenensis]